MRSADVNSSSSALEEEEEEEEEDTVEAVEALDHSTISLSARLFILPFVLLFSSKPLLSHPSVGRMPLEWMTYDNQALRKVESIR